MKWALVEKAYGNYEISLFDTKKQALVFAMPYEKVKRLKKGVYEVWTTESEHIVCTMDKLNIMGFNK